MAVESHNVARQPNDGSRDDMRGDKYDEQRHESHEERSEMQTMFNLHDIKNLSISESRKKELIRMWRWHHGQDHYDSYSENRMSREQQNRKDWKRRVTETYATNIDMTKHQKRRCKHLVLDVLSINSFGPHCAENVAMGVVAHVASEDGRNVLREKQFYDLAVDVGFDKKRAADQLDSLRGLVADRLE